MNLIKTINNKAVEVLNLTKQYGQLTAVDDISFEVHKGEIFGFLGPNGAGKTTTMRILTGLTKSTNGIVKIFGYDIEKETIKAKQKIGIVPEVSNVYDELSAWRNLIFISELYQVKKEVAHKEAEELLKKFGLINRKNNKVKTFSKGMKRKLTVSMGLINNPQLLFLDEPVSGLDLESSLVVKNIIGDLNRNGVTIFLTTHDIEEASRICDRIAIINHGRIAVIDTPERLKGTIQSVQSVEVVFNKRVSFNVITSLEKLSFVNKVEKLGDKYKLFTDKPGKVLSVLWEFSSKNKLEIISLNTFKPSLEDVFIRLTNK